jgi:pyrroline-5-carboxylate reductase
MKHRRIGMLGAGNMATAIVDGLFASNAVTPESVRVSDPSRARLKELATKHGIVTHESNLELVGWADLVVLAVKPQVVEPVLTEVGAHFSPDALLVSIAAGVPTAALESRVASSVRVVRAMPNTPAFVRAGATAVAAGSRATLEDLEVARALFDSVGRTVILDEHLLDAVTGLSGSGPAYVMIMIDALSDAGVKVGLTRETARLLATQTLYGSAKLVLETGRHPAELKDMVTSPGGTTIHGVAALEAGGLRAALIDAVEQATERSAELGRAAAERLRKSV